MAAIERALEILKDGKWHSLDAVINELRLPKKMVERIIRFLAEFEFIMLDDEKQRVKIDNELQSLYTK